MTEADPPPLAPRPPRGGRRGRLALLCLAATAVLAVAGAAASWGAPGAQAGGERAGDAVVFDVADRGRHLREGGSATPFGLGLPQGASCPGDSAGEDYRVQSFMVPAGVDPGSLRYELTQPAGEGNWPLVDMNTRPFLHAATDIAAEPGGPGHISGIPAFSFAAFPPGKLPEGEWVIGIACTLWSETVKYWDARIELTSAPDDEPAQLRWRVVSAPPQLAGGLDAATVAIAAGAAGAAFVLALRWPARRRRPAPDAHPMTLEEAP